MRVGIGLIVLGSIAVAIGLIHRALVHIDPVDQAINPKLAEAAARMQRARSAWIVGGLALASVGFVIVLLASASA